MGVQRGYGTCLRSLSEMSIEPRLGPQFNISSLPVQPTCCSVHNSLTFHSKPIGEYVTQCVLEVVTGRSLIMHFDQLFQDSNFKSDCQEDYQGHLILTFLGSELYYNI